MRPRPGQRSHRVLPALERLEDRCVPAVGPMFHVNTHTAGAQQGAATASSADGSKVVAWDDLGGSIATGVIRAQRFDAKGHAVGKEISVGKFSGPGFHSVAVALDGHDRFVIAWQTFAGSNLNIKAQRFAASGAKLGAVISVAATKADERAPSVAAIDAKSSHADGDFVIAYDVVGALGPRDVIAKMYTSAGKLVKTINVTTKLDIDEADPAVARAADGQFDVAYTRTNEPGPSDVMIAAYSTAGKLLFAKAVAASPTASERQPAISLDHAGNAVVAYQTDRGVAARPVSRTGALGKTVNITKVVDPNDPTFNAVVAVAKDQADAGFVVAYNTTDTRFVLHVIATEVSRTGHKTTTDLGGNRLNPSVSMDGKNAYLLAYTAFDQANEDGNGIFAHLGKIG